MKQKFTFLIVALMLLTTMVLPGKVVGQTRNAVFTETFNSCSGTGGNDGSWSGSIASNDLITDNTGWTVVSGSGAYQCAKFGAGSTQGSAETPEISVSGLSRLTLTFKAGAWSGDQTQLKLSSTNCTLKQNGSSITYVTLANGAWTTYTVDIEVTNTSNPIKIKFQGKQKSKARFFLDEVVVTPKHAISYAVSPAASGTVSGVVYGTSTAVSSGAYIVEGGKVTLTATPSSASYSFSEWSVSGDGSTLSSTETSTTTFTMGTADAIVTAVFVSAAPAYTITAQSNNNSYGTVSLSGSVITGSPNSGYRYADPAYTVSPANSATVLQNGNDFTVTPSANTTITINFEPIPTYTVTLYDNGAQLTEASAGAGVTLPSRSAIGDYNFAGWSVTNVPEETTTAPTIIPAGTYYPTSNITLYPVYRKIEESSTPHDETASVTISSYASAHNWVNGTRYETVTINSDVTATASGTSTSNTGKYYTSGSSWRFYSSETGYMMITSTNGNLKSATITFSNSTLSYNSSNITSGSAVSLSGTSASFYAGGTTYITGISVTYTVPTTTVTYYWSSPTLPAVATPVITAGANPFYFSTTATITCATEGAAIKYSYDNENWSNYSTALTINETKTVYAKAIKDANESSIASLEFTKNLAEPTVTVSGDLTLDLNGETNVAAGTLTAAVTYDDEPVGGATVTWSSSDTDIASIDASGAVTIKAVGEVTFTATYAGNSDYAGATGTKTVTVTDSQAPGTSGNPYTVAAAIAYIGTLGGATSPNEVYVSGIISRVDSYNSTYHSITYWISDDGTTATQMEVYGGLGLSGYSFSAVTDVRAGDIVTVRGYVKEYKGTPEFDKDNVLVSIQLVAPTFYPVAGPVASDSEITISDYHNAATIYYTTNGSIPSTSSTVYDPNNKPTINTETTIKAIVVKTGYTTSEVASAAYTILTPAATPTFSVTTGTYNYALSVTLSTETAGATIYYTTNGADPTTSSTEYTAAITVDETMTIKAIAAKDGLANSEVASATYTINIPAIDAENVNLACEATSGSIVYTITNGVEGGAITSAAVTASEPANWLTVVGSNPFASPIGLTCTANTTSSDRTATVTLTYTYSTNKTVTKAVTVTQSKVDYAVLPFVWEGGTKSELNAVIGVTSYGLGSDYAAQNAPYYLKMDGVGDYIQIKTDSQPSIVTIGVKMIGGANTSKIKIQESTDGSEFTDVEELTISGAQNTVLNLTTNTLFKTETRYVRIIKSVHGHNIGVGPISIYKNMPAPTVDGNNEIVSDVTINNGEYLIISSVIKSPSGMKITVSDKGVLVNTNPANLIIEDGGQLIIPSTGGSKTGEGVKATFQKEITAYTVAAGKDNYYLIANPTTGDINPATVEGMVVDSGENSYDYDLYYFDQAQSKEEWRNYRQGAFDLENGKGYLYANRSNITLEFPGTVPPGTTADITLSKSGSGKYAGFNLVGNPLSNNVASMKIVEDEEEKSCSYYKVNSDNGVFAVSTAPITVGEAFMVQAPSNGAVLKLNQGVAKGEEGFNNEVIRLEVSNSKFTDVAYVYFGNHLPLTKISHLNDEAPMLYIRNGNDDRAVEVYNNRGEVKSINVNFEAKTMGTYTISAKMVKGEIKYMHLYDRLTGIDTDLLVDDYSFIGAKDDQPGRFILNLESVDDNGSSTGSETFAYQSGDNIIVNGEGELQVFDVTGRMVMSQHINGAQIVNGLNTGVYVFRMEGKVQKIVVR